VDGDEDDVAEGVDVDVVQVRAWRACTYIIVMAERGWSLVAVDLRLTQGVIRVLYGVGV
jgi:hypothetical protein